MQHKEPSRRRCRCRHHHHRHQHHQPRGHRPLESDVFLTRPIWFSFVFFSTN